MENSDLPGDVQRKLADQGKTLRHRIMSVAEVIAGRRCDLKPNALPLDRLFGAIKQARDSFVHCEPGPQPSRRSGKVKEDLFHDISKELVAETVVLTSQVIRQFWQFIFKVDGPRWLPTLAPGALRRDPQLAPTARIAEAYGRTRNAESFSEHVGVVLCTNAKKQ
jgi:hypothetical protein